LSYVAPTDCLTSALFLIPQALNKSPEERLPESRVQFYVAEIVLALSYLHQMGLMYRDLKVRRCCVLVVVVVACGGQCVGGVSFWLRVPRFLCGGEST
jgi:serine/threonine protein kinase